MRITAHQTKGMWMDERQKLRLLLRLFSEAQEIRLIDKMDQGWNGWDTPNEMKNRLIGRIIDNMLDGDWLDVANLAMFAWNLNLKPKNCVE